MQGPGAEAARPEFERWRSASPLHAAEYAALERTWDLAAGLGATELGRARTLTPAPRPLAWATGPRIALAAAAMLVIALMVTFWPTAPAGLQPITVAHATRVGEIRTFQLPDGSSVTVDTDSRITILFDGSVRKVKLEQGRARFNVRSDATRAFIVEAGGTVFSANGSGFDVSLKSDVLCASVLKGTVEVRPATTGPTLPAALRLKPGRAVRLTLAGKPLGPSESAGKGSEQWVSGMLVYQGAPLSEVIAETNRYSSRRIVLGDPGLAGLKVTGTFRPIPAEAVAASLAAAFGLKVSNMPGGNFELSRQ